MQRAQYYICNHFQGIRQINKTMHVIYNQNTSWSMPKEAKHMKKSRQKEILFSHKYFWLNLIGSCAFICIQSECGMWH